MKFLKKLFGKAKTPEQKYEEAYQLSLKGEIAYGAKQYDKALQLYTEAVNLQPYIEDFYYNIGLILVQKREFKKSISNFKKALELGFQRPTIHKKMGESYMCLEEYSEAISSFKTYLHSDPNDSSTLAHLGICYQGVKGFIQSDRYHKEAIAKAPFNYYYCTLFGESLWKRGEYNLAFEVFKRAIELNAQDYYSLGKIAEYYANEKSDLITALTYFKSIPIAARAASVHRSICAVYYRVKDQKNCMKESEYAITHYPENTDLFLHHFQLRTHYKLTKNLAQQTEDFLKRQPDAPFVVWSLGFLYLTEKSLEKTLACLKLVRKSMPEDGHTFLLAGSYHLAKEEITKARQEFKISNTLFEDKEDFNCQGYAQKGLGHCALSRGDETEAISHYKKGQSMVEEKDTYLKHVYEDLQKFPWITREKSVAILKQLGDFHQE